VATQYGKTGQYGSMAREMIDYSSLHHFITPSLIFSKEVGS